MKTTIADQFFKDSTVLKDQESLLASLSKYQSLIKGIAPPNPELVDAYKKSLKEFEGIRGGPLFFPYISSGLGNGPFVELEDGSIKYDFISGIGTHHFGHSHHELTRAALTAALFDTVIQGHLQQSSHNLRFSKKLLALANAKGAKLAHCFLTSTGVMAGENALKIAFQKKFPANRILAFKHCFAGRTLTFSQITDKADYRVGLPSSIPVDYIPFFDPQNPQKSIQEAENTLKEYIARYPGLHAAMFFELILGEAGYFEGSPEFHRALMKICKDNSIAVLVDEVQTFARTTEPFAFQYYGLDDLVDVVWVGKSTQVCATLFTNEFKPKPGLISQTFTASTTAIAVGEVILDAFAEKDNYFGPNGKVGEFHKIFVEQLQDISSRFPNLLKGPFGIGAMIAFTAFDGHPEKTKEFVLRLFDNGVMSFTAGKNPTRVRFLIPIGAVTKVHILDVCAIIEKTLTLSQL